MMDLLTLYRQHSGQTFLLVIGDLSSQTQKNNGITTTKEITTTMPSRIQLALKFDNGTLSRWQEMATQVN